MRLAQLCEELQPTFGIVGRLSGITANADAEGTVDQLVNARLNRGGQMRWSAQGAHRVLQVRAAVLDGRLHAETFPVAA